MSRVLVTGGTGEVGSAVVRRLLADPAFDVRIADRKEAPQWMREGCEIRSGDLRELEHAGAAVRGCRYVIHLASPAEYRGGADFSLITASAMLDSAVLRAAIDHQVERFLYVSWIPTLDPAEEPTGGEAYPRKSPSTYSAYGFAKLLGERLCDAAQIEHGLSFALWRPPTDSSGKVESIAASNVDDIAAQIVAGLSSQID